MELSRLTSIGSTLIESLNTMVLSGEITTEIAQEVFASFETSYLEIMKRETGRTPLTPIEIKVEFMRSIFSSSENHHTGRCAEL